MRSERLGMPFANNLNARSKKCNWNDSANPKQRDESMATTHRARRMNAPASRPHPRFAGTVSSVTTAVLAVLYGAPCSADQSNVDEATLQEVVVTATRRAVSAQDLPIAITAVSGSSLDQAGIVDIAGLAHSMAGV